MLESTRIVRCVVGSTNWIVDLQGSCYLLVVPCANPSDRQHKRGRRFIAIFLFSVASRFKNEEGSCYLLVVPCANPSDRQHKRGRRFITMFLFSVASVTL